MTRFNKTFNFSLMSAVFVFAGMFSPCPAQEAAPISDNSFLIEEAYNQDPGVVQHISAFADDNDSKSWEFGFTQEWPLASHQHQISFSLMAMSINQPPRSTGLGDLMINYRYQLYESERTAFSPRFSVSLPSGNQGKGLGSGSVWYQINLPVSLKMSPKIAAHLNLGTSVNFNAADGLGNTESTTDYNYGGSIIYLMSPNFNLMLEAVGEAVEQVGLGETREKSAFINPGFRYAFNFKSGLQIVPGLGFPIGVGPSDGAQAIFLYFSLEHPF